MADVEELHLERADLDGLTRLHGVQLSLAQQPAAGQLDLHQAAGQRRGVNRGIDLLQQVRDGPGVVLMAVGKYDAAHPVALIQQILKVGDNVVDPQHIVFGEHQPRIYDEDVLPVLVGHHILTNFPKAP